MCDVNMIWNRLALVALMVVTLLGFTDVAWAAEAASAQAPAAPGNSQAEVEEGEIDSEVVEAADEAAEADEAEAVEASVVGWLELSGPLREGPAPFAWVAEEDMEPSLTQVLEQLEQVETGEHYLGVVVYLDRPEMSLSQVTAVADAMERVRAAGKQVLTFAEAYTLRDYLLASSADLIVLQHRGAVELNGISVEEIYVAGLLEKIGVRADLMQVGQFKGAEEPWTRTGPSEAWSENMSALLDDLYGQVVGRIAENRGVSVEQFEQIIAASWTMTDAEYLSRGVVDRLADRDLVSVTEVQFGEDFVWDDVMGAELGGDGPQMDNPLAVFRMLFQEDTQKTRRDSIAVIHAVGPISSGESSTGDGLLASDSIGSRTLIEVLGDTEVDDHIKGVVIRIDSPGGSALASEVIWQAMRHLAEQKPVYVSIGDVAASGGYYLASAADEVYVSPVSIVGSIGVVGGKIILGDLYEKIGLNVHRRHRGPLADMFNSVEPFTEPQRAVIHASMERVYEQFTDRVQIGRGSRLGDISEVAEGRLFTGRQAVENGLADRVATLEDAIADVAAQVGLEEGAYDVVHLPPPLSFAEFLEGMFSVRSGAGAAGAADVRGLALLGREALGARTWGSVEQVLGGLMMLRDERALTLMPVVVRVR